MKTITMYELLGMIKDNRAPEKIRIFDGTIFKYYEPSRHYYTKDKNSLLKILDEYRGDVFDTEVEILEEEKKIPEKIKDKYNSQISKVELAQKYNEIIDYLQYIKSKGE